ncbi:GTPase [Succinimonas sp.]|uniref:GTPase n=1 Tax=Succinimonas sp. TaxID=1936151 RepID=UPI00386FE82D
MSEGLTSERLTDYGKEITDLALDLVKAAEPYSAKAPELASSLEFIKSFVAEKVAQNQPEIMVYGIYNAGKSSIINELIGRDEAEVNDKPTTDRVQYFTFNGYRIADTPGVGAPIEHEQITQEHLRKADVVIFVMSNTGSHDLAQNYTRIREIHDSDKKVIIVLNDKNGSLNKPDDTSIDEIKLEIGRNLNKVGLSNKFHIVTVNALRARKGRVENKQKLYELSNMDELVQVITQELKNSGRGRLWCAMIAQLITESGKVAAALDGIMQQTVSEDKIKNYLDLVRDQERCLRSDINSYIDRRMQSAAATLPGAIWAMRDDTEKARETVNQTVEENITLIREHLRDLLGSMKDILNDNAQDFGMALGDAAPSENMDLQCSPADCQEVLNALDKCLSQKGSAFDSEFADKLPARNDSKESSSGILAGSVLAASAITKILPSLGLKVLVPYAGPVLLAVGVLAALFGGGSDDGPDVDELNQAEQARLQAEMQARNELENKCRYMCMNISDQLKSSISRMVSEVSRMLTAPCRNMAFQAREENGRLLECREKVQTGISALENLRDILKSEELNK